MKIRFSQQPYLVDQSAIVVGCLADQVLTKEAKDLDQQYQGIITKNLHFSKFKGNYGQVMSVSTVFDNNLIYIILIGLGKVEALQAAQLTDIGGIVYQALSSTRFINANIYCKSFTSKELSLDEVASHIGLGIKLKSWKCDEFKTNIKDEDRSVLEEVNMIVVKDHEASTIFTNYNSLADGISFSRYLGNLPPNILYPETMTALIKSELEPLGVKVEILDHIKLTQLKMGALLGVAQGSVHEARVVIMQWQGKEDSTQPLAFLGKGVTFDSGGISIKPSTGMEEMKYDMSGAGTVVGLIKTLAARRAKANVVGVVGLVENLPSGNAQRPGDIVTSLSGQTIEVLNTDAEGRLVLADILWYTQDRFKPKFMINLATLTGAIVVALGKHYAGLFSNDDELSKQLIKCGKKTNERLWRLPLAQEYDKQLESDIADMKNITTSRGAGSITAAQFLQRFVNNVVWAHLDIAGVAYGNKDLATSDRGANGFGVRLLDYFVNRYYENK